MIYLNLIIPHTKSFKTFNENNFLLYQTFIRIYDLELKKYFATPNVLLKIFNLSLDI